MSSSCDSLKSVVMRGWVSAEPSCAGCGVVASAPSGRTRRLSFSMPRRRPVNTSRGNASSRSRENTARSAGSGKCAGDTGGSRGRPAACGSDRGGGHRCFVKARDAHCITAEMAAVIASWHAPHRAARLAALGDGHAVVARPRCRRPIARGCASTARCPRASTIRVSRFTRRSPRPPRGHPTPSPSISSARAPRIASCWPPSTGQPRRWPHSALNPATVC